MKKRSKRRALLGLTVVGALVFAALSPGVSTAFMFIGLGMAIAFDQVPEGKAPGWFIEINKRFTRRGLPANAQRMLLLGQRLKARIEPARFQGGTLNDATAGGAFTGSVKKDFIVQVASAGATDQFKYSTDGGNSWSTDTAMDGTAQALEDGVTVQFGATTGHAVGDEWRFSAWPEPSVAELTASEIFSVDEAAEKFGWGSVIHLMADAAFTANRYLDLTAIALDDAGTAVAAAGAYTLSGTAAKSGSVKLYVGNVKVEAGFARDDTAAEVALALQAEFAKYPGLPVDVAVDAASPGKLNITVRNKGTLGDGIHLGNEVTAGSGLTVAVTAMTGGATDPDVSTALANVEATGHDIIATAYPDATSLSALADHLDNVTDAVNQHGGLGVTASVGAYADAVTRSSGQNHHLLLNKWLRYVATMRKSVQYEVAAAFASVMAGESDPARPLNTLELKGIAAQAAEDVPTFNELQSSLDNGVSALATDKAGRVRATRAVTTYTTDDMGIDDDSWLDVTTPRSLFYLRKIFLSVAGEYARAKLNDEKAEAIRGVFINKLKQAEALEIVEKVDDNLDGLTWERPTTDPNRLNLKVPVDLVNGLHKLAARIDPVL